MSQNEEGLQRYAEDITTFLKEKGEATPGQIQCWFTGPAESIIEVIEVVVYMLDKGMIEQNGHKKDGAYRGEPVYQLTTRAEQTPYEDVKALHEALNSVLALFVLDRGWDYSCVDDGLKALARHPEFATRVSLAEEMDKRGYGIFARKE